MFIWLERIRTVEKNQKERKVRDNEKNKKTKKKEIGETPRAGGFFKNSGCYAFLGGF
jgi:hypothetical protein